MSFFLVGSAFVMGIVGQVHCATMCSGMAAMTCGGPGPKGGTDAGRVAWVHAGRISAYATQGALFAVLGAWLAQAAPIHDAQLVIRFLAGIALIFAGLQLAGIVSAKGRLERWTSGPWRRASAWLSQGDRAGARGGLARGFAWGLLPCGLVQGALALSLTAGHPGLGALVMLAFGVGTLPVLLVIARFARAVFAMTTHPYVRRTAGLLVLLSGTAQVGLAAIDAGAFGVSDAQRPCCAGKHQH